MKLCPNAPSLMVRAKQPRVKDDTVITEGWYVWEANTNDSFQLQYLHKYNAVQYREVNKALHSCIPYPPPKFPEK